MNEIPKPKCEHRGCAPQHCRFEEEDREGVDTEAPREPSDGRSPEDRERRAMWQRGRE